MRIACWLTKATHTRTHSEYVTLTAFPLQQWLRKHASMLRYTYVACLGKYACRHFWGRENKKNTFLSTAL
jgi:hypothetical protein